MTHIIILLILLTLSSVTECLDEFDESTKNVKKSLKVDTKPMLEGLSREDGQEYFVKGVKKVGLTYM